MGDALLAYVVLLFTLVAAAVTIDRNFIQELPVSRSSVRPVFRSALQALNLVFIGGKAPFFLRCMVVFVFLLAAQFVVLAALDTHTSETIIDSISANPVAASVGFVAAYIASVWSYSQSIFFVRIAESLVQLWGVTYLFFADLVLSLGIFVLVWSTVFAVYSYTEKMDVSVDLSFPLIETCDGDSCSFSSNVFFFR